MKEKELTIEKLDEMYRKAESCDRKIFAEMRHNILLECGDHYRKTSESLERGLSGLNIPKDQRVRLVKNHTQKATADIKDIILNQVSGFKPLPSNDTQPSDVKSAELAESIWIDGKQKNRWDDLTQRLANSFVTVGETCAKIYFDPTQGDLKGYNQKLDEDGNSLFMLGEELTTSQFDELGNPLEPAPDKDNPEFKGKLVIEKINPFDLLRCPSADTMDDSPYLIHRKMVDVEKARSIFANTGDPKADEELASKIVESASKTYKIFDSNTASYKESDSQVMLREFYFRKCKQYPQGYYVIATDNAVLSEGPIPLGEHGEIAFPIKHTGYEIIETCPRYSGPIRHIRPIQAEINRAASSIAQTQLSIGDDKLIIYNNGTVSKGADMPGVRVLQVTGGAKPEVIAGRSGEQFTGYLKDQIQELRFVLSLPPDNLNGASQATDPRAELFKSAKQKQKFSRPALRFESFGKQIVETYLFLASHYLDDTEVIRAIGKKEAVNISEFKNVDRLDYKVKVEPVSGDYDSMWGKFMELEVIAQYFGKDLPEHTKAAMIKSFPYLNKDPILKDLMISHEAPTNMILALDRGEDHVPSEHDDVTLMLKHLYLRTRASDFAMLSPEIQEKYADTIVEYEGIQSKQVEDQIRIQKGIIPSGGSLTKCDVYVNESKADGGVKVTRATLPAQAIEWLIQALEAQGVSQDRLKEMGSAQGSINIANQMSPDAFLNQEQTI